MSYIDLLFPREELEALGNKWPEPANKRRKLDLNAGLARGQQHSRVQQSKVSQPSQRRNTYSAATQPRKTSISEASVHKPIKRSNSDARITVAPRHASVHTKPATVVKSCLPSFIEPSLLKNYLQHLHPSDRSRYSIPNSPEPEIPTHRAPGSKRTVVHDDHDNDSCSPASLITDNSSSTDAFESCATPAPGIFEQLRSASPFGYLINGLRLTEHEKDLMEDLLSPNQIAIPPPAPITFTGAKRKAEEIDMGFDPENFQDVDPSVLHRVFPSESDMSFSELGYLNHGYEDTDVHSSGLSPGPQIEDEEVKKEQNGAEAAIPVMSTLGFAISVNDFFDLDEASGSSELNDE